MNNFLKSVKVNRSSILFIPAIIGAHIGGIYGSYNGYKISKKDEFSTNILMTIGGGYMGVISGSLLGLIWPITGIVYIARNFDKE